MRIVMNNRKMDRRVLVRIALVGVTIVVLMTGSLLASQQPHAPPSIIVIMTDDMGFSDVGCYGSEIETPNLDMLAKQGLRFTQFYNEGVCVPTRISLLTGLHPRQTGNNSNNRDKDIYLNEALTLEANKAVDQAVADGKPFYLYMSHYAVYAPWEQDDRFLDKYTKMELKGLPAVFASMIESMDKSLGDIMTNLDRLGVADQTIVIFMSDNGCPSQLPRNLPLRGHKITPYEGGTRGPLIVKWPNVVKPATTCNDYLIIEDIFPTFLEMAGVAKVEQIGGTIDGISFVPLLNQKPPADPLRPIFWHFPNTYGEPPYSSVRKGDWKLIYHHADRRLELYHLKEDIGEKQNLADSEPEKLQELADTLTDFLRSADALMPIDKTTGKIVEYPSEVL